MAKTSMKVKQTAACTKVLYKSLYTLYNMWSSTFCFKKVRNLQNLLP